VTNLLEHNFREIDSLNQRGGRTLSLVDLIQAGTLSVEIAAHLLWVAGAPRPAGKGGASVLTGAVPGGAGKTTLLACLLNALPARVQLVTVDRLRACPAGGEDAKPVDSPAVLDQASQFEPGQACFLVHEIGAGHWYGYLWGPPVAQFVELAGRGHLIASCLHADTREQLTEALTAPPLNVAPAALAAVDLLLFMHVGGGRRRVATVWDAHEGDHRLLWQWEPGRDGWRTMEGPPPGDRRGEDEVIECERFVRRLLSRNVVRFEDVRRETLGLHRELQW
jgi:hypothetical protein